MSLVGSLVSSRCGGERKPSRLTRSGQVATDPDREARIHFAPEGRAAVPDRVYPGNRAPLPLARSQGHRP